MTFIHVKIKSWFATVKTRKCSTLEVTTPETITATCRNLPSYAGKGRMHGMMNDKKSLIDEIKVKIVDDGNNTENRVTLFDDGSNNNLHRGHMVSWLLISRTVPPEFMFSNPCKISIQATIVVRRTAKKKVWRTTPFATGNSSMRGNKILASSRQFLMHCRWPEKKNLSFYCLYRKK